MTECTQERFEFTAHFSRRVEAGFSAGQVSSDGGGLLLREVDRKIKLVKRVAGCFSDGRSAERVEHTLEEMLSQRIFGLALGYEDLNDHEQLRFDPLLGDGPMIEAKKLQQSTGKAARVFSGFAYSTLESWSRSRRVVAKAEYLDKGENPRFLVTSLDPEQWPDQPLYEQLYCARGEMETASRSRCACSPTASPQAG